MPRRESCGGAGSHPISPGAAQSKAGELLQEVTGGVTNYVARLPEVANTVEEWKASIEQQPISQVLAEKEKH